MLFRRLLSIAMFAVLLDVCAIAGGAGSENTPRWAGTWATAPQPFMPGTLETFENQTLRLIVHTSVAGAWVRVTLSNVYGDVPLNVSHVHAAIRTVGADIDPNSNRAVLFHGQAAVTIGAHRQLVSDPIALQMPALTDLAVSFFLPRKVDATTSHLLALQTSYVAAGDSTAAVEFPIRKTIDTWPFLTDVEVRAPTPLASIAVIGSSTTDGDGSTRDGNQRWPDVLAQRLQAAGGAAANLGVLNLGIIGNRLLKDSPQQVNGQLQGSRASTYWNPHAKEGGRRSEENPFGMGLGEAGLTRLERDVLARADVRYLIVCMGVNDIVFPGAFTSPTQGLSAEILIRGYRQLLMRAHEKSIRVIITTIPPFEHAVYSPDKTLVIYTPGKEIVRQKINAWIRATKEFDGMVDFDAVLRDPAHPTQLLTRFDSGDHLHCNDAGYAATAAAIPLTLFGAP